MESFTVTCETCHARLRVRDPRVVGEVHACPKCDSMVHILPPAGHGTSAPSMGATAGMASSASVEFPAVDASQFESAVAEAVSTTQEPSITPTTPDDAARVSTITSTSPWVLWGIGAAALLVIGGVVGAWWSSSGDEQLGPVAKARAVGAVKDQPDDVVPDEKLAPVELAEVAPKPEVAEPSVDIAVPEAGVETPAQVEDSDFTLAPALPTTEPAPVADANASPKTVEQVAEAPVEAAPSVEQSAQSSAPAAVLKFDPLDFDPARIALNNAPAQNAEPTNTLAANTAEEPISLDKSDVPPPAANVDQQIAKPTLSAQLGPATGANQIEDAIGRLAVPIAAFEVRDMPLSKFIRTISDVAGLPITVDPFELELAGSSAEQPITLKAENSILDAVAREALSKRRLAVEEREGQLVVVLADGGRTRAIDYDLADLANDAGVSSISKMITRFVAPETWQENGGNGSARIAGGKLHVEQSQRVQHEILIFCERLRLARELPLRTRYPRELLKNPSAGSPPLRLEERTTFTFLPWTPFSEVVDYWQESNGLTVLVDWSKLAKAGLGPSSPVACSAVDRTFQDVLDGTLEPLGMAWTLVDANTIQVTTRDGLDQKQRVEFYSVSPKLRGQFASVAALVKTVEAELQQYGASVPGKPRLAVAFDEPSGQLIVLGTPGAHRHLTGWLHNQATL